jgi:hypothetical protein
VDVHGLSWLVTGALTGGRLCPVYPRNEQVVGSIPIGGSLYCCSETFIDLNFDDSPISVERFVERAAGAQAVVMS